MSRRIVVRREAAQGLPLAKEQPNRVMRFALQGKRKVEYTTLAPAPPVNHTPPRVSHTHGGGLSVGNEHCLVIYGIYFEREMSTMSYLIGITYHLVHAGDMAFRVHRPRPPLREACSRIPEEAVRDVRTLGGLRFDYVTNIGVLIEVFRMPVRSIIRLIFSELPLGVVIDDIHFEQRIEGLGVDARGAAVIQAIRACLI